MPARAKRKRSRVAVLTGKREDTLACLRGAVIGGAEKEKDLELPERALSMFMILNFRWFMACMRPYFIHSYWR
jgi:hypothetical protein